MSSETVVDAGLLRGMKLPAHEEGGDKDVRGSVLAIGGSRRVPGAIMLSAVAALRAGAGRLGIGTCQTTAVQLGLAIPESMVMGLPETEGGDIAPEAAALLMERASRSDAILIGPGMTDRKTGCQLTAALLAELEGPAFVLDAGAMRGILEHRDVMRRHAGRVVITPHAGEMASLLDMSRDDVLADPLAAARRAASQLQVVVAMKGRCTRIVTPEGRAWASSQGNVGLATSGSGDVLAGIIAGLMARGAPPLHATVWGVFTHGEAGRRLALEVGPVGYLARELLDGIPTILADLGGQMEPSS
ncbi:MAG TPA: NAD(P)H-hydrate dehydratase [Geminicoccus sp.]|jgi:hydroxyethylthiazole kinase-like uncharacterized protein yjeF|uniref:NAD(P)H-hydrate dehydratase n=1 Tax=Geminicoccus sp. TaxID=2024832 RepID=UPI002E3651AC|nr:NAD(P)H-hydrate dehydratase [Geminicoccus sp.]HEX2525826.1 NAD(P)H-hydrate dehydratase [Geminicoccus sp.]